MSRIVRAVSYCRVSTCIQQISLEAQQEKIKAMAIVKDLTISETIVDSDASARSLDRPGMIRLLQLVDSRKVDVVLISRLDRLTRNVYDLGPLMIRFDKNKVSLVSVDEMLDTKSASGRVVLNIMVSVSQFEREAIGERTATALRHLKKQGFPAGPPPYGWASQPRTSDEKRLKIRKPIVKNPEEQKVLALMKKLNEEGASLDAIAFTLNERGYRTRSGGQWVFQAVARHMGKAEGAE